MVAAMKVLLRKRGDAAVGNLGLRDGFRVNGWSRSRVLSLERFLPWWW